jgi:hypothetical protein
MRSTPIVCSPKTMMMAPAIFPRTSSRAIMKRPIALADAPSATNTIEKPTMNASEEMTIRRRTSAGAATTTAAPPDAGATAGVPRMSSSDMPEM